MNNSNYFSEWLRKQMEHEGLSIAGLARAMGVAYTTVRNWLIGTATPRHKHIQALARLLHVREADVYGAILGLDEQNPIPEDVYRVFQKFLSLTPERRRRLERYVDLELADQQTDQQE
jgi:transcriptional regulator with XRE-family HTH domain